MAAPICRPSPERLAGMRLTAFTTEAGGCEAILSRASRFGLAGDCRCKLEWAAVAPPGFLCANSTVTPDEIRKLFLPPVPGASLRAPALCRKGRSVNPEQARTAHLADRWRSHPLSLATGFKGMLEETQECDASLFVARDHFEDLVAGSAADSPTSRSANLAADERRDREQGFMEVGAHLSEPA